ncbi:MAG: pyruvate kinase alpha/beta domain-containing protein [Methanobacterium sp.]|nr:pyruvate kinase alpha/beta domain-containing protein [Methanobacterium sp.]
MEKSIHYFENSGEENTNKLIELVKIRRKELGIKHIVVASASGRSGVKLAKNIRDPDVNIVNITHHAGFKGDDIIEIESENRNELENMGVKIYIGTHSLSGVGRGISNKFGGITPVEIIAATLRLFSQGIKVGVEISIMACDASLIPTDTEIIAVGGSATGLDAAIVLKPAHMGNFFDLKINEIIAMPRP